MHHRTLARKFDRYRRQGDVRALGDVFDAAAPELARAAAHLVREAAEVDDLVQSTFLTALERADRWDGERRLVPWFMGILVRHAHAQRRSRTRVPDPHRLEVTDTAADDPARELERAEVSAALAEAVRGLPAHYRDVIEPLVLEGATTADIAARSGRAPGVVRVQQGRGFELLRRALPSGLAFGLAVDVGGLGLTAVREQVLARGATLAPTLALSTPAVITMGLGQKLTLALAAAAALTGLFVWTRGEADTVPRADHVALAPETGERTRREAAPVETARELEQPLPARSVEALRAPAAATSTAGDPLVDPDAALAGASGRVLDTQGTPVLGVAVELYAVGLDSLDRAVTAPLEPITTPAAFIARSITDAEGRFELRGARVNTMAVIGVDLGGPRAYSRLLDEGLARGATSDLGDIVLPDVGPFSGFVVDASGAPIEGARVRVASTVAQPEWRAFLGISRETPLHVGEGFLSAVIDLPQWLPEVERLFPFTTTFTDASGRFHFDAAPLEGGSFGVDADGFVAALGPIPDVVTPSAPADAGAAKPASTRSARVALRRGRAVQGRVIDAEGRPVRGAEVRGGSSGTLGAYGPPFTPLVQGTLTDAQGDFRLSGLDSDAGALLAARAQEGDAWSLTRVKDDGNQTVTLPARFDVEVAVVGADGAPVSGAQLALARPALLDGLATGAGLLDPWGAVAEANALGQGRYAFRSVAKGSYKLIVRAADLGVVEQRLTLRSDQRDVVITLSAPRVIALRLVDAVSGAAVRGARIAVMERPGKERTLGHGTTDSGGFADVEVAAVELDDILHVRVEHAAYGLRRISLPRALAQERGRAAGVEGRAPHVVHLAPAGRVRFVLQTDPAREGERPRPMAEMDDPRGPDAYHHYLHRRFGLADEEGVIEIDGLAPGPWSAAFYERYLDGDPFDLIDGFWPKFLGGVDVEVAAGETTTVEVDLRNPGATHLPKGAATLRVRVTRNGDPVTDQNITLVGMEGLEGTGRVDLDSQGEALFEGLAAGTYGLSLVESEQVGAIRFNTTEHFEQLQLGAGESRLVELRLTLGGLNVLVLEEGGAPAVGVDVRAIAVEQLHWEHATTDDSGRAAFPSLHAGELHLSVEDQRLGTADKTVVVEAGATNEAELTLVSGVPCAGRIVMPPLDGEAPAYIRLSVLSLPDEVVCLRRAVDLEAGEGAFRWLGLKPGRYRVVPSWRAETSPLAPLEFELPQGGDTQLELRVESR